MGTVFRWAMFVTSFLPLWVTIAIKNLGAILQGEAVDDRTGVAVIASAALCNLIAGGILWRGMGALKRRAPEKVELRQAARERTLTTEYLLAYLLPLFVFDFTDVWELAQFGTYLLVLAFLCIRNGNVYANLLLELRGYRCYACTVHLYAAQRDGQIDVWSRRHLDTLPNSALDLGALNRPVYLDLG